jgi:hypothetical protein
MMRPASEPQTAAGSSTSFCRTSAYNVTSGQKNHACSMMKCRLGAGGRGALVDEVARAERDHGEQSEAEAGRRVQCDQPLYSRMNRPAL